MNENVCMNLAQPLNEHSIPQDWLDDNLELDEEDTLIIILLCLSSAICSSFGRDSSGNSDDKLRRVDLCFFFEDSTP